MEGWFPRSCGEHTRQRIAMRWDCTRTESSDRATRNSSAAARVELREQRLNSRPSSWNESRRPDRRICGDGGSTSCAPTLWKEREIAFSAMSDKTDSVVPCLPPTSPQAFDNERGRSLPEESRWEGDSDVGQSTGSGDTRSVKCGWKRGGGLEHRMNADTGTWWRKR